MCICGSATRQSLQLALQRERGLVQRRESRSHLLVRRVERAYLRAVPCFARLHRLGAAEQLVGDGADRLLVDQREGPDRGTILRVGVSRDLLQEQKEVRVE